MDKCLNPFFSTIQVSLDPVAQDDTGVESLLIALKNKKYKSRKNFIEVYVAY